jgi:hypothetical protein
MGMQIYVQKLSVPSEEWSSIDVESSDTIEGVKSKLSDIELPAIYDPFYIKLFYEGIELQNGLTLSNYNIQKDSHLTSSYRTGLSGVKYNGYFDGNTQWFATATRTGDTELRSGFYPVYPVPESGFSWEWTGYFKPLSAEGYIEDNFIFDMSSDDIGIMWVGETAVTGYNTSNRAVSSTSGIQELSEPVALRADTYYPVRIQYGHPVVPTINSLYIQANPSLRQANDFVEGCLFNTEFEPVPPPDPYAPWGGFANWQRLRLLEYV